MRNVATTSDTTTTAESLSGESEEGSSPMQASVVWGSIESASGEDISEGVRMLDEDLVRSPADI